MKGCDIMKKQFMYIMAVLLLLLVGCAEEKVSETPDKEPEEEVTPETDEKEEGEAEIPVEEIKEPLYKLNEATWGFHPIDDADAKVVLLTFDDAPDKRALDMAKTLKELDAPAIFFVNGHFIDSDEGKADLKEIHDLGFPIGNHTKTHADLQQLSEADQKEEILFVSDTVEEVIGERPKFFRAPFGQNTDYSKALVKEEGMLLMNWSYGYDWEKQYMDADAIADIMVNAKELGNGANLLMHDREWTADGLKDIVEGFREKDYSFIDPDTIKGVE